jgi:outer membrane receptor protein involved in Fe transport
MPLWALAQAAAIAAAPAPAAAAQEGVTSYPASFFATQNANNADDMLGRIPGFTLDTGANVRGFEGAAGNVLINGQRPASKTDSLDTILIRIPVSRVERIDIIRGGAPGIDMQGKSVIANVILKSGSGWRGLLAESNYVTRDGRYFVNNFRAEASGTVGPRTWELAGRIGQGPDDSVSKGRSVLTHADGRASEQTLLDSKGLDTTASVTGAGETPLLGGRLRLNGRWADEKFKEPENDRIIAPTADLQAFGYVQKTTDTEVGGRFSRAFGTAWDLELVGLRTTRHRDTDSSSSQDGEDTDFFNRAISSERILRAVIKHRFGQRVSAEAGVENADNELDSRTRFTQNRADVPLPAANVQVEELRTEAFVKATWRPIDAVTLDASLRYESSDISAKGDVRLSKSLQFAKPRLALTWQARPQTQVRLRFEREVGQLDFNDFVANPSLASGVGVTAGNPDLNPQQAWTSEAAVEQQVWKGASVVLTYRHQKLTDVIDRGPVFAADGTVFDRPTNIGSGTEDDVSLVYTLPLDAFGWKGALIKGDMTRRWTAVTDPTTGEKRRISDLHPDDWNLSFSQDLPRHNLYFGIDLFGGFRRDYFRFNLVETIKLATYVRPYLEWKPAPAWSLRWELPLATAPDVRFRETLQIFPGPRNRPGAPDVLDRQFHFPRGFYFRVLRNIG